MALLWGTCGDHVFGQFFPWMSGSNKQLQKLKDEIWRKDNSFVSVCFPENTLEKKECKK